MATPQPIPDSLVKAQQARADSIAALRAAEKAKARAEEARVAERRRADSLAALDRASEQVRLTLAETIHFDFDKSYVRPGDAGVLDRKIPVLKANPTARIQIAGNCDERGSDEYNLALGNRRAISARRYLVDHGIDASRIETVSYGKERPLDPGHDEAAWAKNRNDEFQILTANVVLRQP
ncbi:MAG: peptidoglycan-associated lipoprotein Pal, partial [Gemmatimonadetes bacterium]